MKKTFIKKLLTIILWIIIVGISIYFYSTSVSPYFNGELSDRKEEERWWLILHFTGATCTLFLGPIQFWAYFRNRFVKWHRLAGKIYIGGSIVSALMVFYLLANYPLPGSIPSLGLLALLWIFTTIMAFWFAAKKNFKLHKQFMIRSYVCGLAFVIIRLLPYVDEYTGIFTFIEDDTMKFTVYEWICWVYPLVVTELLLIWWPSATRIENATKIRTQ